MLVNMSTPRVIGTLAVIGVVVAMASGAALARAYDGAAVAVVSRGVGVVAAVQDAQRAPRADDADRSEQAAGVGPAPNRDDGPDDDEVAFDGYSRAAEEVVDRILKRIGDVETLSAEVSVRIDTGMPFTQNPSKSTVKYAAPKRIYVKTPSNMVVSDGREITTYIKRIRRYVTRPLRGDVDKQVKRYVDAGMGLDFHLARLVASKERRRYFAERFRRLTVRGEETIDGDACVKLEGRFGRAVKGVPDEPVVLYVRKTDDMIRRIELDRLAAINDRYKEGETGFRFEKYVVTMDVTKLRIDERIDADAFVFKPPAGAHKVERFYGRYAAEGARARRYELSGEAAPAFALTTADGATLDGAALRGTIYLMAFFAHQEQYGASDTFLNLDAVRDAYADKKVSIVCVVPETAVDHLVAYVDAQDLGLTVVADRDGGAVRGFLGGDRITGYVLVDKDGVIQGQYDGFRTRAQADGLRADLDALLAGKALPSARPMSEAERAEAAAQRDADFSRLTVEPLHEERLKSAWSVAARSSGDFSMVGLGTEINGGDGLWILDGDALRLIDADGTASAALAVSSASSQVVQQTRYVVGRAGRGWIAVTLMPTYGEGEKPTLFQYKPPTGAKLIARDESGEEVWTKTLDVDNGQMPQMATMADVDGRGDDELVFLSGGAIWITDAHGEVLVRKPVPGFTRWMIVEDRDNDRRAELYVRGGETLQRFDYRRK